MASARRFRWGDPLAHARDGFLHPEGGLSRQCDRQVESKLQTAIPQVLRELPLVREGLIQVDKTCPAPKFGKSLLGRIALIDPSKAIRYGQALSFSIIRQ